MHKIKDVFSIPEAAKYCAVDRVTFWRWVKSGQVKTSATPGGHHRIMKEDLESFMVESGLSKFANKKFANKKILIVDDDPNILKVFSLALSSNNYQTAVALNGFVAGISVMQFQPDLIILDLIMPEIDGFEVCKRLKGDTKTSHIKIIVLTGYDTKENKKQAFEAGADMFLAKPVEKEDLLDSIESLLTQEGDKDYGKSYEQYLDDRGTRR